MEMQRYFIQFRPISSNFIYDVYDDDSRFLHCSRDDGPYTEDPGLAMARER